MARCKTFLAVTAAFAVGILFSTPVTIGADPVQLDLKDYPGAGYQDTRDFQFPYEIDGDQVSAIIEIKLFYTCDGVNWVYATSDTDLVSPLEFTVPEDGVYGFCMRAVDAAGNEDANRSVESVYTVDTEMPTGVFSMKYLDGEEPADGTAVLGPGAGILLAWDISDANLPTEPVVLEATYDGGETYERIGTRYDAVGKFTYRIEGVDPSGPVVNFGARLRTTDRAGNETAFYPRQIYFKVDPARAGLPPVKTRDEGAVPVEEDDTYTGKVHYTSNKSTVNIFYETTVGTSKWEYIELWYTTDYGYTWLFFGRDNDLSSPFAFKAQGDGYYGFYIRAANRAGVATRPRPARNTAPDCVTLVDTKAPTLHLISPRGGEHWKGSRDNFVEWQITDAFLDYMEVWISTESGAAGSWFRVKRFDKQTGEPAALRYLLNSKSYNFSTLRAMVKAVDKVGNETIVQAEKDFTIDIREKPTATITKITPEEGASDNVPLKPDSGNGGAGALRLADMTETERLYHSAIAYRTRGEYDKAIELFSEVIKRDDSHHPSYYEIAYIYLKRDELDKAKPYLAFARELDPENEYYHAGFASYHIRKAEWADAAASLLKVIELAPLTPGSIGDDARWNLALIYVKKTNETANGVALLREILAVKNPESVYKARAQALLDELGIE